MSNNAPTTTNAAPAHPGVDGLSQIPVPKGREDWIEAWKLNSHVRVGIAVGPEMPEGEPDLELVAERNHGSSGWRQTHDGPGRMYATVEEARDDLSDFAASVQQW